MRSVWSVQSYPSLVCESKVIGRKVEGRKITLYFWTLNLPLKQYAFCMWKYKSSYTNHRCPAWQFLFVSWQFKSLPYSVNCLELTWDFVWISCFVSKTAQVITSLIDQFWIIKQIRSNGQKRSQFENHSYFSIFNPSETNEFFWFWRVVIFWYSENFFLSSMTVIIYITSMKQDRSVKNECFPYKNKSACA